MATQISVEKVNKSIDSATNKDSLINDTNPLAVAMINGNISTDITAPPANIVSTQSLTGSPVNSPLTNKDINDNSKNDDKVDGMVVSKYVKVADGENVISKDVKVADGENVISKDVMLKEKTSKSKCTSGSSSQVIVHLNEILVDVKGQVYDCNGCYIFTLDKPSETLKIKGRQYRINRDVHTNAAVKITKEGFNDKLAVYNLDTTDDKSSSKLRKAITAGEDKSGNNDGSVIVDIDVSQSYTNANEQRAICYKKSENKSKSNSKSNKDDNSICQNIIPYNNKDKSFLKKKWSQFELMMNNMTNDRYDAVMKALKLKDCDSTDMIRSLKLDSQLNTLSPSQEILAKKTAADLLIKNQKAEKQMDIREQIQYRKNSIMLMCFLIFLAIILIIILK